MSKENHAENKGKEEKPEKAANDTKERKKSPERYLFECQRCGQCCEKKASVVISMADLERWSKDATLPTLYSYLTIEAKDDYVQISLKKSEDEEGKTDKGCPLYDAENKLCNIYFSMPLHCKSFPLGYDGDRYFLKDSKCPGIGKGKMSEETLREARNTAKDDFEARISTTFLLPVIHGLALRFILERSKRQIDGLTTEQKEKLGEILGEEAEDSTGFGKDGTAEN